MTFKPASCKGSRALQLQAGQVARSLRNSSLPIYWRSACQKAGRGTCRQVNTYAVGQWSGCFYMIEADGDRQGGCKPSSTGQKKWMFPQNENRLLQQGKNGHASRQNKTAEKLAERLNLIGCHQQVHFPAFLVERFRGFAASAIRS